MSLYKLTSNRRKWKTEVKNFLKIEKKYHKKKKEENFIRASKIRRDGKK